MSATTRSDTFDPFAGIEARELRTRVEAASASELDALSFGVIRLNDRDNVIFYSRTEAQQSGYGDRTAIGKQFWTELAPCMRTPEFMERLNQAKRAGAFDISFEQVGDFDDAERQLQVRLIASSTNGAWVFIRRP